MKWVQFNLTSEDGHLQFWFNEMANADQYFTALKTGIAGLWSSVQAGIAGSWSSVPGIAGSWSSVQDRLR